MTPVSPDVSSSSASVLTGVGVTALEVLAKAADALVIMLLALLAEGSAMITLLEVQEIVIGGCLVVC